LMLTSSLQLSLNQWMGEDLKSIRPAVFVDIGQLYTAANRTYTAAGEPISRNNPRGLRVSAGLSMTWLSPMGPLEFSLGYPIEERKGDKAKPFSFSMGTTF